MDLFALTRSTRDRRWAGYVIGIAAVAVSAVICLILGEAARKFPFVIFLPPVVLTTFVGGLGAGIASAILAGCVVDVMLIAPIGSLWPEWPNGFLALSFYALTVSIDIALIHALTATSERATTAETALRRAKEDLELRVADRTAALREQVAEREAAEAQVRQLQKMESIGQLTGGIAHDFNNMLAVVIGSIEMALRRADDPERVAHYIGSAEQGAKRAAQLVTRLLAFSRQQALEPRVLDTNQLVGGMSELMRRTIGEQVKVETVLAGGLWRCYADAMQVENAVLNLAVNARDAMPEGGKLTIETANSELDERYASRYADVHPGQYVMICVTDTGTGMPAQVIERAFDPFYTTKGVGKGTGLGLSQVYGFVKQSGGHVAIYSEIGEGTTVRIYLPRHHGPDALQSTTPSTASPLGSSDEIVLVVEDEAAVRHVSVDALRELGYTVVQASDGKTALSVLEIQPRVDVMFTDIVMPEMNGRQLVEAARARWPDLKVIYTTGYTRNAVVHNGMLDTGVAFLAKPFTLNQLATKVRDVLDGHGINRLT